MQNIRYWKISPRNWKEPDDWIRQWRKCRKEKIIQMGWNIGDLTGLTLEQIRDLLEADGWEGRNAKQLWNFRNEIKKGDIVIANKGQKEIAGIGKVNDDYFYDKNSYFVHTRPVKWLDTETRQIPQQRDWLQTVIPLTKQKVRELGILRAVKKGRLIQDCERRIRKGAFSQREVETRNFQQAFRNTLLELYQNKCAVCDVDDEAFLRGCHIVPVRNDKKIAADLTNGICLCVLHDVAFENGIFSISDEYKVIVTDSFNPTSSVLESQISKLNGKKIRLPAKQRPNKSYLKRHRKSHGF